MDKIAGNAMLDIESLISPPDACCAGSPKMLKALSRKGSIRVEKRIGVEQDANDSSKKLVVTVVASQMDQLKQPLSFKTLQTVQLVTNNPVCLDIGEGRNKRLNRLRIFHPRKILLLFATMSSLGTIILIYFTLAINRRGGD